MFDLSILNDTDIHVTNLGVFDNDAVAPPAVCHCPKGSKLFSRFFYVTKGRILFNCGQRNFVCGGPGDLLYLPYDVPYESQWSQEETGGYVAINFVINRPPLSFSNDICVVLHDETGAYLALFRQALELWNHAAYNYRLKTLAAFLHILCTLSSETTNTSLKNRHRTIYAGIAALEQRFTEDLTVTELARLCNVSEGTFRRLFKEYKQMSPITYRNFLRMKRAEALLKSGEYTVSQAGEAVNCSDPCYFNRLFRQFFHVNPSEVKF